MLWTNKKLTQSVTFTEDAADIALLEAIEQELSRAKYQTFSNLCKQALWQFLSVTESAPGSTAPQNPHQLEQHLALLQTQVGELENNVLTEEKKQFTRVEARLNRLAQQLAQIQASLDLQTLQTNLSSTPPAAPTPAPQTEKTAPPSPKQQIQPQDQPQDQPPEEPVDPLLHRLSSLLDDF